MTSFFNGVLRECQLNGIGFPVSKVNMDFSQDVAIHKYPNVPGANIESLSRNPIIFTVEALFINGLSRDKTETWSNLFPNTFEDVMRVLNSDDNPTIKFQHPTLGKFNVKVQHGSTDTTYTCLNGQVVNFTLIEDGNNDFLAQQQQGVLGADEQAQGSQSVTDLDQRLQSYQQDNPDIPPDDLPNTSGSYFTSLYNTSISSTQSTSIAVGTSFDLASNAIDQLNIAKQQLFSLSDPTNAFMMIDIENANSALNDQRTNNNALNVFTVRSNMTLNQVLIKLQNYNNQLTIEKLIVLNPQISMTPFFDPGTVIYWS